MYNGNSYWENDHYTGIIAICLPILLTDQILCSRTRSLNDTTFALIGNTNAQIFLIRLRNGFRHVLITFARLIADITAQFTE